MKSDFERFVEENEKKFNEFWSQEYPKLSLEEKKKYWLASTHRGMRSQGEALGDEYTEFSKKWYDFAKENEPDFDEIFKDVVKNLGFDFDWGKYYERIKK
jgi:hypothetical protein